MKGCSQCQGINALAPDDEQNTINESGYGNSEQSLTPQQMLVIAGILTGLLEVDSMQVYRDGLLQITLEGKLKRKKK